MFPNDSLDREPLGTHWIPASHFVTARFSKNCIRFPRLIRCILWYCLTKVATCSVSNERNGTLRCLVLVATLIVLASSAVSAANARNLSATRALTLKVKLHKHRSVVNFYNHRGRWALHPYYRKCWQVPIATQRLICTRARAGLRYHGTQVRKLQAALRRLATAVWPPHHKLWLCIHGGEGNWDDADSGRNGHFGGLQMHADWGYGTSHHASDDSQATQEWAAEKAYNAAGSNVLAWLYQQWGADAHCFS